nr:MAG TPA: hypothetical protein [Caudoviricetes sp.]
MTETISKTDNAWLKLFEKYPESTWKWRFMKVADAEQ